MKAGKSQNIAIISSVILVHLKRNI